MSSDMLLRRRTTMSVPSSLCASTGKQGKWLTGVYRYKNKGTPESVRDESKEGQRSTRQRRVGIGIKSVSSSFLKLYREEKTLQFVSSGRRVSRRNKWGLKKRQIPPPTSFYRECQKVHNDLNCTSSQRWTLLWKTGHTPGGPNICGVCIVFRSREMKNQTMTRIKTKWFVDHQPSRWIRKRDVRVPPLYWTKRNT